MYNVHSTEHHAHYHSMGPHSPRSQAPPLVHNYCVTFELALAQVQRSCNNCAQGGGGEPGTEARPSPVTIIINYNIYNYMNMTIAHA